MVVSLWYNISMRIPNTRCEVCQKPLYRRPSEKGKHFCCKGCRSALYKREQNYNADGLAVGRGWNKGLSKANGDILIYGKPRSPETKKLMSELAKINWHKYMTGRKYQDTDIEIILEDWLKDKGIKYEKQKQLLGITLVDFFIEPNICLYADGDYWHNIPKVRQRDGLIRKVLRDNGYKTIWLKGSAIKSGVRPKL